MTQSIKILKPTWPQAKNIHAFTTLKGCKITDLNLPDNQFWIKQEHGIKILNATINTLETPAADGSYTMQKNLACVVKTADCLPILVSSLQGDFVAAIHAGWRGLANGIINNFFNQIKQLNIVLSDLLFWLGPAIGPLAFEVGDDVVTKFNYDFGPNDQHENKHKIYNSNSFGSAFKETDKPNKYLANIYQLAKINLYQLGINDSQIFSENWCTYFQDDLFYSYRRDPQNDNRMYSLIWIN